MHQNFLPLILINGLLDSFNPCAIAVLLLFIGLLFTLGKSRKMILVSGLIYIVIIYLTYLGIGLGILRVCLFFGMPHFAAYIGAGILILIGLINLKDYFKPEWPISVRISLGSRQLISKWAHRATIPAIIVVAFLVGICEFPCSGGIYLATLGLLAAKETFWRGFGYLLIYNLMFVLPLIIILLIGSNRLVIEKWMAWQEAHQNTWRLVMGLVMIGLGVLMIFLVRY